MVESPFFIVTGGEKTKRFLRRSGGKYLEIDEIPKPKEETHLASAINSKTDFGEYTFIMRSRSPNSALLQDWQKILLEKKLDDYFKLIVDDKYYISPGKANSYSLKRDITMHYRNIKRIRKLFKYDIERLTFEKFIKLFEKDKNGQQYIMNKQSNFNKLIKPVAKENIEKIKQFLIKIRDTDSEELFYDLFKGEDHVKGVGLFLGSQFLSGAHPEEYTIIQEKMVDTMKDEFKLINVKVDADTTAGYLYINDVCKSLLEVFKNKIEENKDRLVFEIDVTDFKLVLVHEFFWEYKKFECYDQSKLVEAQGEQKEREKVITGNNIQEINAFMT